MDNRTQRTQGFTLIEVTFATGILFLSFVLLTGALAQLAGLREMAERRHLAVLCLEHCAEQVRSTAPEVFSSENLVAPVGLVGTYDIQVSPLSDPRFPGALRLTVSTQTARGHHITVSALCTPGAIRHAT